MAISVNTNRDNSFVIIDDDEGDSDKTIECPNAARVELLSCYIDYTASAEVGDRRVVIEIIDADDDVVAVSKAGEVQVADAHSFYQFSVNQVGATAFTASHLRCRMPAARIGAGYTIHIYDENAIDADGDDMIVTLHGFVHSN